MDLEYMNTIPRAPYGSTEENVDFWARQCNLSLYFLRVFPAGDPAREKVARELREYRVRLAHALKILEDEQNYVECWNGWPITG